MCAFDSQRDLHHLAVFLSVVFEGYVSTLFALCVILLVIPSESVTISF